LLLVLELAPARDEEGETEAPDADEVQAADFFI